LLYGLLMGVLLLLLEVIQYKVTLREIGTEIFGAIIASVFLALGVWIGITIYQKKSLSGQLAKRKMGLSTREIEVLGLLALGHSNKEIADKLFVSINTIKTHISSIYQKLHVSRRTQAVQRAQELKIIATHSSDGS